ncbi:nitric oxide reductase NorD protein [Nitrosospira multiformis ATCC 25196]|uniref:Nitric oxide reductase NorD protein n=1 Tax=Nitrosospira multiformis (strain ATCC 25196 / NCIMB 11849 / C 71) TaxID=323848 RepID=Q2Y9L5_NITMU|nr:VWA domain-containing protein [Nitrosospira multiformis]ABB74556.1 von Willebrand factor, type A [Nitrosospira multiformis ATCC 25196]SEF94458.1 nitric oxide reductase NorD protein [Nitrosospira multiformis ATCC 25196]
MAEPEGLIIDAARHTTAFVSRLWNNDNNGPDNSCTLSACRQRLEFLLSAVHGQAVSLRVAPPPPPPSALSRLFGRIPRHLIETRALPANDGTAIFLPMQLPPGEQNGLSPHHFFRLLALQQAGRARRRAQQMAPADALLTLDLFQLSEAAAADHTLALHFAGLRHDLTTLRRAMLSQRPQPALLNKMEQAVEELYWGVLKACPDDIPPPLGLARKPEDSLGWAVEMSMKISTRTRMPAVRYRGCAKDLWWGKMLPPSPGNPPVRYEEALRDMTQPAANPGRSANLSRRPQAREKTPDEDDQMQGMWMVQKDDPQQHVEDPAGLQRPADRDDDADAADLADSLSELPEAPLISSSKTVRELLLADDPLDQRTTLVLPGTGVRHGIAYPEWDFRVSRYHKEGAIVRLQPPLLGDVAWAESVVARCPALLRQVQLRLEGLRPRRIRYHRQPEGEEIDINAWVNAFAERRAGLPPQDRLYQSVKAARRDIAVALLIDISGSTDGWVSQELRIIDVEKEALLLVYLALAKLGDPFCIYAFSGEGPQNVSLWPLKNFEENDRILVQRRIAALEPQLYTRAGAAIRHTTSLLAATSARYRLLILLSDGKPNDVDRYEGRYGVEDMRQAVTEARLQAIHPFCITVDRQAPQYLARVFGARHYAVLQQAETLPVVLADVLRRLIRQ